MSNILQSYLPHLKLLLSTNDDAGTQPQSRLPKVTRTRVALAIVGILGFLSAPSIWQYATSRHTVIVLPISEDHDGLPPLYSSYHFDELALPQNNPDLPFPEGRTGKYVWFRDSVRGAGWGNILQEHFLHGLLAHTAGRSFVFTNYTWSWDDTSLYSDFNHKVIPARIPFSALISGPLAGGSLPPGDPAPRAVNKVYFDEVCPHPRTLDRPDLPDDYSAGTAFMAWLDILNETKENCAVIEMRMFHIFVFGSERILDIVPTLFQSPMFTLFRHSPLITNAFETNRDIVLGSDFTETATANDPYPVIPGLLALHIRRGDYEEHCKNMAGWGSTWTGLNQIEGLERRRPHQNGGDEEGYWEAFSKTCFPTISEIVEKVREARTDVPGLNRVFIMTNAPASWIEELKAALEQDGSWDALIGSRDLVLGWEQSYVKQAVDMLIGQRADVFIGNGFSSMTGNVVLLRVAKGLTHPRTRFW